MSETLSNLFNLPPSQSKELTDALETANTIDNNLPAIINDEMDKELDDLADQAMESFENLQSLGMNVEPRFSAPIFEAATKMFGHALTAKLGKVQKKLKQTEIALKIEKMKQDKEKNEDGNTVNVEAQIFDRNSLLTAIRNKQ